MKKRSLTYLSYLLMAVLFLSLPGCCRKNAGTAGRDVTLEVALYPYVPDMARFQEVVSDAWEREHPDVSLHFADWDCYVSDPDPALDVFVFDGIYLSSFIKDGYLMPIPEENVRDREDIFPFALEGCKSGGELFALPQLLCTEFLYTRKDDPELSSVSDVMTLYGILVDRKTQSVKPEEKEGLLIDLSNQLITKTVMYLDSLMDEQAEYTDYSELTETSKLSEKALERIAALWKMGGDKQVSYWPEDNDAYVRARWFSEGRGRAYIGYAEAMAAMGDYADDVLIRRFSYGTKENIPLFYTDMVGINPKIGEDKKELALDLANLLISGEVLTGMSMPAKEGGSPQYLLTARKSVYDTLGRDYPIYRLLLENVDSADNHVYRLGAGAREFIADMEKTLAEQIRPE